MLDGIDKMILSYLRKSALDILGYGISMAAKLSSLARPNQIIISHAIYDCIHKSLREEFSQMELDPAVWKYSDRVSTRSLEIYHKLKFKTIEFPVIGLHTP